MFRVSLPSFAAAALLFVSAQARAADAPAVVCASGNSPLTLWDTTGAKVGTLGPSPQGEVKALAMAQNTPVVVLENGEVQTLEGKSWSKADTLQAHGASRVVRADERRTNAYFFVAGAEPDTFGGSLVVDRHGRTFWNKDAGDVFRAPDRNNPVEPQPSHDVPEALQKAAKLSPDTKADWAERAPWGATFYAFAGEQEGDLPPSSALWMVPKDGAPVHVTDGNEELAYAGVLGFGANFAVYQAPGLGGGARLILQDGKVVKVGAGKSAHCALFTGPAPKAGKKK